MDSISQEFGEGMEGIACLCSAMPETSAGKSQPAGAGRYTSKMASSFTWLAPGPRKSVSAVSIDRAPRWHSQARNMHWFPRAVITNYHKLGGLNYRN